MLLGSCGSDVSAPVTPTPVPSPSPTTYAVSGTVRDTDGLPLQGASVYVGGDAFTSRQGAPSFTAYSDAAGVFRGSLPAGGYSASAKHPGYERVDVMAVQVSGPTVLDFTLHLGIMLGGRVLAAGSGGPPPFTPFNSLLLNDVVVELTSGPNKGLSARTNASGVYTMQRVLPGDLTVRASKTGYESVEQTVHAVDDTNLDFTLNSQQE